MGALSSTARGVVGGVLAAGEARSRVPPPADLVAWTRTRPGRSAVRTQRRAGSRRRRNGGAHRPTGPPPERLSRVVHGVLERSQCERARAKGLPSPARVAAMAPRRERDGRGDCRSTWLERRSQVTLWHRCKIAPLLSY